MNYASLSKRFLAFTIDCITVMGVYMLLGFVLGISTVFNWILGLPLLGFWFFGGLFAVAWLYFALFESSRMQATPGKRVMGLKVVNLKGERIGFTRASVRYFSKFLSRLILMIGFLMIAFTKKKQALHDKIARSLVIAPHSTKA